MKIIYLSKEFANIPDHEVLVRNHKDIESMGFNGVVDEIKRFEPDIIIEREFNDGISVYDKLLKQFPKVKKAFWGIDSHLNFKRHLEYAENFDYIFLAISKFAGQMNNLINKPVKWLPLYFPGRKIEVKEKPEIELSFVGNFKQHFFKQRREYLEILKPYGIQIFEREYSRMPKIMNNSLISFNCSLSCDLNFRVFEALGYGSLLLTNYVDDIDKIDGFKRDVYIYKNKEELINIVRKLLKEDYTEFPNIGLVIRSYFGNMYRESNQQWILENHCLKHRIDSLIEMIVTDKQLEF